MIIHPGIAAAALTVAAGARAAEAPQYTLFNPVPHDRLRDLSADRPDTTESPFTVDAGHAQIELSVVEWSRDEDGARVDTATVAPVNLKLGLTMTTDLQLVLEPWTRVDERGAGDVEGFGDTTLRLKWNLWGNDGGGSAGAIMPFVTFPTGPDGISTQEVEGGVILPVAFSLPDGVGLGAMLEIDLVYDDRRSRYTADLVHTIVVSRELWDGVGAFLEYAGAAWAEDLSDEYRATLNTGLTWTVTPDWMLDAGVRIGLTEAADDITLFAGSTMRF
ncbi:MAG: hypothetical protein AMXMBFR58_28640 [Phycisphaerae bacterium]